MYRVGFKKLGSKNWMGGHNYLKNLSSIINSRLKKQIELKFIKIENESLENVDIKKFNKIVTIKKNNNFLIKILNYIYDFSLNKVIKKELDIYFELSYAGLLSNNRNIISWIPDFQHRRLPDMFSFSEYWKREIIFKIKILFRRNIIVSSYDAKKDCINFYNKNPKHIHVLRFSIYTNLKKHTKKLNYLKKKYKLNKNYIYVPNQFWIHKNQEVILKALEYIKSKNLKIYNKIPQIIFSGRAFDFRSRDHVQKILKRINSSSISDKVKYLGVIPLDDVYKLNANCLCLINPSFFEGWSTTVEEAKSFGTPKILSNIPIHKEQSPKSIFFNPDNYEDLAKILINIALKKTKIKRKKINIINKELEDRNQDFANNFIKIIKKIK
jgi:hypothetical protein